MPDIPVPSETTTEPQPLQSATRSALNSDLHDRAANAVPINALGEAGKGAAVIARRIERANTRETTDGRTNALQAYNKGVAGEREVAEQLKWLPGDEFWVLHDQPWPGRPKANIDHIVVGRSGIFVVDAKNWSGRLEIRADGIYQNGSLRANTVSSLNDQSYALLDVVRKVQSPVTFSTQISPILAFCGDNAPQGQLDGVRIMPADMLARVIGESPDSLPREQLQNIAQEIERLLIADRAQALHRHSQSVRAYKERENKREQYQNRPYSKQNSNRRPESRQPFAQSKKTGLARPSNKRKRARALRSVTAIMLLGAVLLKPELLTHAAKFVAQFLEQLASGN